MWPIADPLDDKLAVMVSEYNMTQQKELELQLSAQHLSLQRSVSTTKPCLPERQLAHACITTHRQSEASSKSIDTKTRYTHVTSLASEGLQKG